MTDRQRRYRRIALLTGLGLVVLVAGYWLRAILNPFLVACLIAYILKPMVDRLEARRIPRTLAIILIYLAVLAGVGVCVVSVVPRVLRETRDLVSEVPAYANDAAQFVYQNLPAKYRRLLSGEEGSPAPTATPGATPAPTDAPSATPAATPEAAPPPVEAPPLFSEEEIQKFVALARESVPTGVQVVGWIYRNAAEGISGIFRIISLLVLIPVYAFFILLGMDRAWEKTQAYLPGLYRERITRVLKQIHEAASHFFRGKLVICLVKGLFTAAGFLWVGVPFGLVLGLVSGVASFIPFLNLVVALVPAVLLTLMSEGVFWALMALGVYIAVEALEAGFLVPFYLGGQVSLHPVTLLLALFIGAEAFGLFGMLLSVPLTCTLKILFFEFVDPQLKALAKEKPPDTPPTG